MKPPRALALPAALLFAAQVIHGATPAPKTSEGGYVGLVGGLVLLLASIAVVVGARGDKSWARPLAIATGLGVSVGFLSYHATPLRSPLTNPYIGTSGVGIVQWLPVLACMGVGVWLVLTAWATRPAAAGATG